MRAATNDPARRPWWKKKRRIAAAVVLLAVAYPASSGPVTYATWRGWLPFEVTMTLYDPAWKALGETTPAIWWDRYSMWWGNLAREHRTSPERQQGIH